MRKAALSAKNAVLGRVAAAAAAAAGEAKEYKGITATAVRLFKYLAPESYDDFVNSVRKWVHTNSDVLFASDPGQPQAAPEGQARLVRTQALYTEHVIPEDLLRLMYWPATGGVARFFTVAMEGETLAAARERLERQCVSVVLTKLARVDEHPTMTRFFTFRGGVGRMLTMDLLGLPRANGFEVKSSARELSHKRLKKVRSVSANPRFARHCVGPAWFYS